MRERMESIVHAEGRRIYNSRIYCFVFFVSDNYLVIGVE